MTDNPHWVWTETRTRRQAMTRLGAGALGAGVLGIGLAGAAPKAVAAEPAFPPGAVIRTLFKDYPPAELAGGATPFHEHLSLAPDFGKRFTQYLLDARAENRAPGAPPPDPSQVLHLDVTYAQNEDLLTEEMKIARREGIACIVDAGTPDMGRDIALLRKVSTRSGMPIVACGGLYAQPFYPSEIHTMSEEQIAATFIKQAETDPLGAYGEIGSWNFITTDERKVFRAVARAHLATGLPIFTHTGGGRSALEQLDILEDAGVEPKHVAIGHLTELPDPTGEVVRAICRRGAFVGFDEQGGIEDEHVVPVVMSLLEADFASAEDLKRNKGMGYAKTVTVFLPKLRKAGVSADVLHRITTDNARRFLAFVPKVKRKA